MPLYREVVRRMGRDGWLGVGWPEEYGGRGLGQVEQQIFVSEAARADVPLPAVTLQTVGPTLQAYGTQQQKDFFLPRILAGEVHFAIGYTEPEAGTDLAALRTRAERVRGASTWSTGRRSSPPARTRPTTSGWPAAPTRTRRKHKGISILIVDTTDPGFSWTPIITHDGAHHVNATYYSDVRVPASMRVGAENAGLAAGHHPAQPRAGDARPGRPARRPARPGAGLGRATAPGRTGGRCSAQPDVRRALARSYASLRVNELLNWQVAVADRVDIADASATKVYSSVQVQELGQLLEEVVGRHGDPADAETAELARWLDVAAKRNTVLTFGGGVNEILRELIATAGLGLPRVPR